MTIPAERGDSPPFLAILDDTARLRVVEGALAEAHEALERMQEQLAAMREQVLRMERLARLGRLAGGVAHQIRNPLSVMANASHVLAKVAWRDDIAREAVAILQDEVGRADRIVGDLLDYARVRPPVRRAVSLDELCDDALASRAIPGSVRIVRDLPARERVSVDAMQVVSALGNLVENAIESMPSGGTLRLAGRREGGHVILAVEDTGHGIAPEVLARLFEPLVTTKSTGTGLGLTIALTLIENQSGAIACITSERGTRFELRLPRAETAPTTGEHARRGRVDASSLPG